MVTCYGIVDTGILILATKFETSRYVGGTSSDESSETVGSSTASAAAVAGNNGIATGKRGSERECVASSVGRIIESSESKYC